MKPGLSFGKFTLHSLLGAGGMGEVWKARDNQLGRWVALKFIKGLTAPATSGSDISTANDDLARFLREAQTSGRLNHPNIAAIYETGQDPPFIAMQLIDGRTLRKAALKDPRQIVSIIRDIARAVAHAHDLGVIHRDIKPDNLMVTDAGHPFVMDFGLARTVESNQTASGFVVGTPAYMPPEQARGEKVDERADLYALGASLYELLTGRPPFTGSTTFSILVSVITDDPIPPATIVPAIGPDLQTIILTCMEKERDRRYPTATALADDLDRWLAGEPIDAKPVSTVTRIGRKLKRRPSLVIAALVVVAAPLILVPWLLYRTGNVARVQSGLVERMRSTSETCLSSALDLRRTGNLDGMERYSKELEAVCREVMRELPASGEPHQLFGRMLRAQGREAEALAQQEEALRKEPSLLSARYERLVLLSRRYREQREQAVEDARRSASMQLAARAGGIRAGLVERNIDWREVVAKDPASRDLLRRLEEDLARIGPGLGAAELACAEGLRAWVKESYSDAAARLRESINKNPRLDEAYEALGALESEGNRDEESVKWWTAGIEQDRGSLNLLLGRARAHINWAFELWKNPPRQAEIFQAALRDCDAATALAPRSIEAWTRRGLIFLWGSSFHRIGTDGDPLLEAAIDSFTRVITLAPAKAEAWMLRGGSRVNLAGNRIVRGESHGTLLDDAITDLNEALRLDDTQAESWAWRGNARSNNGQLNEAIADFGEALKRDADRAEHWLNRASTQLEAKAYDLALADLGEVIRRWPRNHEGWILRGRTHTSIARACRREARDPGPSLKAALADLTEGVTLAPVYSDAWEGRGAVRMEMAMNAPRTGSDPEPFLKAALADFEEALRQNPSNPHALLGRATARGNLGEIAIARGRDGAADLRAAIADCTASLALKPKNAESYAQRAAVRANLAKLRPSDAEELFRTAVEDFKETGALDPPRADTWVDLAVARLNWAQLQLSRREDPTPMLRAAIEDASKALEKNPRLARAFQIRAGVHEEFARLFSHRPSDAAKEFELALGDFTGAIEADPGDGDAWRRRGALRVNRAARIEDDPRELISAATADFDKAIALNKLDALSFWFRGNGRGVRGRWRIAQGEKPVDDAKAVLKDYGEAVRLNPAVEPRLRANRDFWTKFLGGS